MATENYARLSEGEVLDRLSSSRTGISDTERAYLLARHGKNVLPHPSQKTLVEHIFSAFVSPLALVLAVCCIITFGLHEFLDALVILVTLLIHMGVSVYEDLQAQKSFIHIDSLSAQRALVLVDGVEKTIPASDLVPGDILVLVGGARVPADARLLESNDVTITESALTGEWAPVSKSAEKLSVEYEVGREPNMVWHGTFVSTGRALAVVVATGMKVKLFSFAYGKHTAHKPTPLQHQLSTISSILIGVVALICMSLYLVGVLQGESIVTMLLLSVAVAVAAIPSGLPAMMTVVLAHAMHAVARKGGKLKSITSAETCGSVTYILTDKTGTLTTGEMSLTDIYAGQQRESVGAFSNVSKEVLAHAVYASDAIIEWDGTTPIPRGRPIEQAIVIAGIDNGIDARTFQTSKHDRLQLVQFEPTRRYAISMNNDPVDGARVYFTGSPEHIAALCTHILTDNGSILKTPAHMQSITNELQAAASVGKRAIAVAYRTSRDKHISEDMLHPHGQSLGFTFSGLLFFGDTVRPEVSKSLTRAAEAGIRVVMVTGDHAASAQYVAEQVGLTQNGSRVIQGAELDTMNDESLVKLLQSHRVFARLLPEHKIRIAHVLQEAGEIVAMTGDGVNDAGALVAADIGVVPESATDVAKDAADLILTESKISVIVDAVREGRRAFYNMRRVLVYLLGTGLSEVLLVGTSLVFRIPLPLGATQILWANMVQEGCMTMPFARHAGDSATLKKGPSKELLTLRMWSLIALMSITIGSILILIYLISLTYIVALNAVQGTMFVTLSLITIFVSFPCAENEQSIFLSDITMEHLFAVSVSLLLLCVGSFVPLFATVTHGNEAPLFGWGLALLGGAAAFMAVEVYKFLLFGRTPAVVE